MLGIFTACEGVSLGVLTSVYSTDSVLIAVGTTAAVAVSLTIFAFQTKWDVTAWGGVLIVGLVVLMVAGILMLIIGTSRITVISLGCMGALIFGAYIVYNTQLMLGGSHKYSLSPEEYIFAALNLYLDISLNLDIWIFLYILMIVGGAKSD